MITSTVMSIVFAPTPANPSTERTMLLAQIDAKEFARELLTKKDFQCFDALMVRESHWKDHKNPSSSARGIGQLLDGTYRNLGLKRGKSTVSQTVAALAYIGRKYGSAGPCGAWATWKYHKTKTGHGWY
jgi:hypothetical protein